MENNRCRIDGSFGSLVSAARKLPERAIKTDEKLAKRTRFWFNFVFATEGLAIAITIAVCNAARHPELIPLPVALIVGIHFFPLAFLFRVKLYHCTGALLCLLAVVTWLFVPGEITLGKHPIHTYMSVVGFGAAFVLWGTGLLLWLEVFRNHEVKNHSRQQSGNHAKNSP